MAASAVEGVFVAAVVVAVAAEVVVAAAAVAEVVAAVSVAAAASHGNEKSIEVSCPCSVLAATGIFFCTGHLVNRYDR